MLISSHTVSEDPAAAMSQGQENQVCLESIQTEYMPHLHHFEPNNHVKTTLPVCVCLSHLVTPRSLASADIKVKLPRGGASPLRRVLRVKTRFTPDLAERMSLPNDQLRPDIGASSSFIARIIQIRMCARKEWECHVTKLSHRKSANASGGLESHLLRGNTAASACSANCAQAIRKALEKTIGN